MRRFIAVAVAVGALFGAAVPASAQVPAPKVTINGLLDFATSVSKNWSDLDVTDGGKDHMWYSRQRGIFTITAEVGRSKAVWSIELDGVNGVSGGTTAPGNTNGFDLDTDVNNNATANGGFVETKWLYLETPVMGPGSLMPFIPVSTLLRAGAQPARGHEYKVGILFGGDFPGVTFESTWAPNLKSTVTYAQIGEGLNKVIAPNRVTTNEDYAFLASVEFEVFKGLTIKPTYAYADYTCGNTQGSGTLGTEAKGGFTPGGCTNVPLTTLSFNDRLFDTHRHTLGGDVRWTAGPFTVQPTFFYQFGEQGVGFVDEDNTQEIQSWIFDTTAGFRAGPINIEGRFMWTPGMKAGDTVFSDKIRYYQSINPAFAYMAGWTEIQTSGIEYNNALLAGAPGVSLRQSPSYDKYGRIFAALAADYALTPALTLKALGNLSWTDKSVDTDAALTSLGLVGGDGDGDARFLGFELNAGLTYRFAPNVAFDLIGAYMITGKAMDHARTVGGEVKDADNIYKGVARVRFTF
jgi:opacity protein-like surface antigen